MIVIFFYYSICFEGQGCYTASLSPFHPESHRLLQRTTRRTVRDHSPQGRPSVDVLIRLSDNKRLGGPASQTYTYASVERPRLYTP